MSTRRRIVVTPQEYQDAVLDLVERIPPRRVMSYGAIADYLADWSGRASPRLVGQILARPGHRPVPWHRVVQQSGRVARGHEAEALRRVTAEGTPLRAGRVDMARAAWSPEEPPGNPRRRP